jgi:glycosyltransferase involved in cell wall biosynthesis
VVEEDCFRRELGQEADGPPPENLLILRVRHGRSPLAVLRNANAIRRAISAFRPDLVHLQESLWDYLLATLPWLRSYPLVLTIHDPVLHSGESHLRGLRKRYHLYRWLLRRTCNTAIAHGDLLRREVEALLPRLRGRVFAIPHGPLGAISAQPDFGWEPGCLLFFGRIQAYKGLAYFIEAVQRLADEGLCVKGLIAGRGGDLDRYRSEIESSGLFEIHEGYIPKERVPEVFRRAQVVVLPYTDGTQSGVAGLAMAYARPVVASRVGSIPEMVREGENGLLVPPMDSAALAVAIRRLVTAPEYAQALGLAAWHLAQGELSWPAIAERSAAAYGETLRLAGRKPSC